MCRGQGVMGCQKPPQLRYSLVFDRSTVKQALQNTQNDCHKWLSDSSRVHQIRFWPGLCPGPRWGAYSALPDPLAGLRGLLLRGGKKKGREHPHLLNSCVHPWSGCLGDEVRSEAEALLLNYSLYVNFGLFHNDIAYNTNLRCYIDTMNKCN